MKLRSALLTAALALALGGCWTSDKPLMPEAERDAPPIDGMWSDRGDGGSTPTVWSLEPQPGQRLLARERTAAGGWSGAKMLAFDEIDRGVWLVQVTEPGEPVAYVLFDGVPGGDRMRKIVLACRPWVAEQYGAKIKDDACQFSDYAALRRAAGLLYARAEEGDSLDDEAAEAVYSDVTFYRL
jgi:hypothetical protein